MAVEINGYSLIIPEPEIFVLHKTLISSKRLKPEKQEKDLDTVRNILPHVDKALMLEMFTKLTKKQQKAIEKVNEANFIDLWQ